MYDAVGRIFAYLGLLDRVNVLRYRSAYLSEPCISEPPTVMFPESIPPSGCFRCCQRVQLDTRLSSLQGEVPARRSKDNAW